VHVWRGPAVWAGAALLVSGVGGGAWAPGLLSGVSACGGSSLRITIAVQPEMAPAHADEHGLPEEHPSLRIPTRERIEEALTSRER